MNSYYQNSQPKIKKRMQVSVRHDHGRWLLLSHEVGVATDIH